MKKLEEKIIRDYFDKGSAEAVLVFGSQATGRANPESDIDLAVLYKKGEVPLAQEILYCREDLAARLKRRVDLIVLNRANPIITRQVFESSRVLLNRNEAHLQAFFVCHVTAYADLKRTRKIIEDNMLNRRLYGKS